MPAIFGLAVANHVILAISGYPQEYLPSKNRDSMYDGILGALQGSEGRIAKDFGFTAEGLRIPITKDDVGYLIEEVYHGRSVISGLSTRLALVRWKKPQKDFIDDRTPGQNNTLLKMNELVCMTKEEAAKHEKEVLRGGKEPEEVWDGKVVEVVRGKLEEESRYERFR